MGLTKYLDVEWLHKPLQKVVLSDLGNGSMIVYRITLIDMEDGVKQLEFASRKERDKIFQEIINKYEIKGKLK